MVTTTGGWCRGRTLNQRSGFLSPVASPRGLSYLYAGHRSHLSLPRTEACLAARASLSRSLPSVTRSLSQYRPGSHRVGASSRLPPGGCLSCTHEHRRGRRVGLLKALRLGWTPKGDASRSAPGQSLGRTGHRGCPCSVGACACAKPVLSAFSAVSDPIQLQN